MGIKQSTAYKEVYGELGRRLLSCRYKWKQVKFWSRVIELPNTRLVKKAFNLAMELDESSMLIKSLKKTLRDIDKQLDWENQNHFSKFEINSEIKQKVNSCFYKNWYKELAESLKGKKGNSKLRTYKEFKQDLKLEKYLTCVSVRVHRIALTKLTTSAHQLRIETGRYKNLEEAERKCLLCYLGKIEWGIHFLTRCPFFNIRRKTFFNFVSKVIQNFNNLETDKQFLALMSCENEIILKKLGQFVFGSFKKRTEFLF